ncbi:synemin isoform X1 [Syngnathus acus]|uniref:synemin isoform X1 n=1 Tax=Syngnathus acus TaxID=161584 RepID=UPI0018864AFB|nr:synemin isoform X1 [Syngnathus acus]
MLPSRRTFEADKQQLQLLNGRLTQYLTRTQQLERENACLLAEINQLRQAQVVEREPQYKAEVRELRRAMERVALEKSRAEMEREKLCRELQTVRSLCSQQSDACRDIGGELHGREKELRAAHHNNALLQQRLVELQREYALLEETHRQQMGQLRHQVDSQVNSMVITQSYHGPPAASMEDVEEYARGMSESWTQTLEMYQQKVQEMEQAIQEDQAMLDDLQREKMLHTTQLDKLQMDAEKQGQQQMRLEEQLLHMQEKFSQDEGEYQMIIDQLERERNAMAEAIGQRTQEHQHLLRVKMDLGMEVAAYRALLEGERVGLQDAHRKMSELQRERTIDIKMAGQRYAPRTSAASRQRMDVRFTPSTSIMRRSPVVPSGSTSPSRVIPISLAQHQSPACRRDMISFTKSRAATSSTVPKEQEKIQSQSPTSVEKTKKFELLSKVESQSPTSAEKTKKIELGSKVESQSPTSAEKTKKIELVSKVESQSPTSAEKTKKIELVSKVESQSPTSVEKTKKIELVSKVESQSSSTKSSVENTSGRVLSPPRRNRKKKTKMEKPMAEVDEPDMRESERKDKGKIETTSTRKAFHDNVSVEDIIETVIKPAGLEAEVCSSGEPKITYHVEKSQQGDGSMKTQIVLQSKVEEEVDVSEESALNQLLSQGLKKVSLEDIEDTATGSMIRNLLSGLQGEGKSVNVEIIEQPVESYDEVSEESRSVFYEPSAYFQIEEMKEDTQVDDAAIKSKVRSVRVQEEREKSFHFSRDREPAEYFVSTPDDNLSEPEEGYGITSYGHYGMVDDLSDERYYQDDGVPQSRSIHKENKYRLTSDRPFLTESIPECIIEEEIRVSPVVQESMLEFLREDSLEPKEQIKGALEKLQGSVSGPLREELAFLTKVSSQSPQNVAVKKVQKSSDGGTTTIVAELNVSQTLEDSGLLDEDDLSEQQIMAALSSSDFGNVLQGVSGEGYSLRFSKEQHVVIDDDFDGEREGESSSLVAGRRIKPSEMEGHSSRSDQE